MIRVGETEGGSGAVEVLRGLRCGEPGGLGALVAIGACWGRHNSAQGIRIIKTYGVEEKEDVEGIPSSSSSLVRDTQ